VGDTEAMTPKDRRRRKNRFTDKESGYHWAIIRTNDGLHDKLTRFNTREEAEVAIAIRGGKIVVMKEHESGVWTWTAERKGKRNG
jgi:hypothetical protein